MAIYVAIYARLLCSLNRAHSRERPRQLQKKFLWHLHSHPSDLLTHAVVLPLQNVGVVVAPHLRLDRRLSSERICSLTTRVASIADEIWKLLGKVSHNWGIIYGVAFEPTK